MSDSKAAELHGLLKDAMREINSLRSQVDTLEEKANEPIAIIGMGCRFPGGAHTPEDFWKLLQAGKDAVVSTEARFNATSQGHRPSDKPSAGWAALLDEIDGFDADFFGISPREAVKLDPQQRLLLEVAWEAFEAAGYRDDQLLGSPTAVFVGEMTHDYEERLYALGEQADMYAVTGNMLTFSAGRLSYIFGLQGPCIAVDTACSSSLVAVHLACQSLRKGESNLALACATNLILSPVVMDAMAYTNALSPDGRCKTFDARANGYVRGEGCGALILKRLSDAQRDNDNILAVVRGSAVNQDGSSSGLTAPNALAQVALIRQALLNAQATPEDIGYIEAHGTGTPLGDPIEMEALREVMGAARGDGTPLPIGAVKTNIGHLEAAAGMASIIKVVMALQHEEIPRHLHMRTLNPMIRLQNTPLVIATESRPWKRGDKPRLAGISAFAMSGTNAHLVLQEAPARDATAAPEQKAQLLVVSARSQAALMQLAKDYLPFLETVGATAEQAHSIAYNAGARRTQHRYRLAVAGTSTAQWREALAAYVAGAAHPRLIASAEAPSVTQQPVVFVFPGQGSQWLGMGRELLQQEPEFRRALEACDAAVMKHGGFSVLAELSAPTESSKLSQIDVVQPVLFCIQVALAALWRSWGVEPSMVVGHSMGEVAAACVSGGLSLDDAAKVICLRSHLMRKVAGRGAMVAVDMTQEAAEALIAPWKDKVSIAVRNGPRSLVVSGDKGAIEAIRAELIAKKLFNGTVNTDVAFHSPDMDTLMADLATGLAGIQPQQPTLPVLSTVTGVPMQGLHDAAYWVRNLREPVEFGKAMQGILGKGFHAVVEVSAHPVLVPAITPMLRGEAGSPARGVAVGSLRREQPERMQMLSAAATLYVHGINIAFSRLHTTSARALPLPGYPWQHQRYWVPNKAPRQGRALVEGAHPLLGTAFSASSGRMFWDTDVGVENFPYLLDHRVGGAVVFPGAGYMEMLVNASRIAFGKTPFVVEDVAFHALLVLAETQPTRVQLELDERTHNGARLQICSLQGETWQLHASARVRLLAQAEASPSVAVPRPTGAVLAHKAFYEAMASTELHYGPTFQRVEDAWSVGADAWGHVKNIAEPGYFLHPAYLDAALHLVVMQAWNHQGKPATSGPWVPIAVGSLHVYGPISDVVFSRAQRTGGEEGAWEGSMQLLNEAGTVMFELQGLRVKQLAAPQRAADAAHAADDDLFLTQTWEKADAVADVERADGSWLILGGDKHGLSNALQAALAARGGKAVQIPIGGNLEQQLTSALSDADSYRGVIYLWGLNAPSPEESEQVQRLGCDGIVQLVQTLMKQKLRDMPRLWLVSSGAQHVLDTDAALSVSQTLQWGLGRSIAYEHPELRCTRVDVRMDGAPLSVTSAAEGLLAELLHDTREDEIALRAGARYVGRLIRRVPTFGAPVTLRKDGTYLLSGGLGGLGLSLARWMATQGAGHLVLMGRSAPRAPGQLEEIAAMRAAGAQVHVMQADVAKHGDMVRVMQVIESTMPPLRGVVHAAGVLDPGLLIEQTTQRFAQVLAPKVAGAWNLHVATLSASLDFFVMYSSASALLGSPRFSSYAAGNAFLDGLAALRHHQKLPALSINWGVFSEVGLAGAGAQAERIAERGMLAISPAEGNALFGRVLAAKAAQVGLVKLKARQWLEFFPRLAASPFFAPLMLASDVQGDTVSSAAFLEQLRHAPAARQAEMLEQLVHAQIANVLRSDAGSRIEVNAPFKTLGLDSLMSLELRNALEGALGLQLPATVVWIYPTTRALAAFLAQELGLTAQPAAAEPQPAVQTTQTQGNAQQAVDALSQMSESDLLAALDKEL